MKTFLLSKISKTKDADLDPIQPRFFGINVCYDHVLHFESDIKIDLEPQQTLNTSDLYSYLFINS